MSRRWSFLAATVVAGVALDYATKQWALSTLQYGVTREAWNGFLKLTLSFNRGAAFGFNLGAASRPVFVLFTLVTLTWLLLVFRRTAAGSAMRVLGIALVCAGAVGNLIDRVTSAEGVIDFLGPYDLGFMLWPIFNVADIFVVSGIVAIMISLRHGKLQEKEPGPRAAAEHGSVSPSKLGAVQATGDVKRTLSDP